MPKNNRGPLVKKGKPSGPGRDRAALKDVHVERLDKTVKIEDEYIGEGDETLEGVRERHPNRNLDKPDIDKPVYS